MIRVTAPAKIILFGEHAVVYNQPAIAIPVSSLRAEATAQFHDNDLFIQATDLNNEIITFEDDNPLSEALRLVLNKLNIGRPKAKITVHSQIPIASGLGSGAAISTVMVRAISQLLNIPLSLEEINNIVFEIEKIHHGTPSGIDNTVVVYEKPIYFVRNQPIQSIENAQPLTFLIANTGKASPTKITVGDVRKLRDAEPNRVNAILEQIGEIVQSAAQAMREGNTKHLGDFMYDNHELLRKLTVSSDELDNLVLAAKNSGALGAKLSGGGRGGNMIALVTPRTKANVKQSLLDAGAVAVYETTLAETTS